MTSTHTTEPTTGESYTTLANRFAVAVNTAELDLVAFLTTIPTDARHATALAVRRRTTAEAHRYTHAADLAVRMPDLFAAFRADGRYSLDHLDAIWSRVNRHTRTLATAGVDLPTALTIPHTADTAGAVDAAGEPDASAVLDTAVAVGVAGWVHSTGITCHTALADVADEVLCTVAPLVVQDTEADEAAAVSLTRRGTRLTLDCGSEVTTDALWSAINTTALDLRRDTTTDTDTTDTTSGGAGGAGGPARPAPLMAHCRGQVALSLLGGHRDQLTVTVNTYRGHGEGHSGSHNGSHSESQDHAGGVHGAGGGPCYVLGSGWVSARTGAELTALAELTGQVRALAGPADIPDTTAYRFTTAQKAWIQGRDGHCRFPGCTVPASGCEHDHLVNSPHTDPTSDGPTGVTNGICLCRTHHTLKTAGVWHPASTDEAVTLHWSGPGGVSVTTVASGPLSPAREPA